MIEPVRELILGFNRNGGMRPKIVADGLHRRAVVDLRRIVQNVLQRRLADVIDVALRRLHEVLFVPHPPPGDPTEVVKVPVDLV